MKLKMLRAARRLGKTRASRSRRPFSVRMPCRLNSRDKARLHRPMSASDASGHRRRRGLPMQLMAFAKRIGFRSPDRARVFAAARRLGLPVKLHAEQLSNRAAQPRRRFGALSADHLEHTRRGRRRRDGTSRHRRGAAARTRSTSSARRRSRRSSCCGKQASRIAIATDSNPGTSPLTSLLLTMNMAATLFRLTVDESLPASRASRHALGCAKRHRHAGSRQVVRPCHLERRTAGRAGLPHRASIPLHAGSDGEGSDAGDASRSGGCRLVRLARHLPRRRRHARSGLRAALPSSAARGWTHPRPR